MGSSVSAPHEGARPEAIGAATASGTKGYAIAAVAVGAVLIVGGALVVLSGDRDGGGDGLSTVATVGPGGSTPAATTQVTVAVPAAATTDLASTAPETTTAPTEAPTLSVAPTSPLVTAPPITAPPVTAPPVTAPPITAPPIVVAPTPASTVAPATLSFAQAEAFFRAYVATAVAGDHVTAWNMLSSSDQADYPEGFDTFVGFWLSVSFAEVQRVESVGGSAGFQSLVVDMAYGQVDGDPTSLEVVEVDVNLRPDGALQIFDYRYIRNQ